jgi:tRNA(fMet)-specific endonuclease VapC
VIVDTNALSAIAEGQLRAVAQLGRAQRLAIPVIVLGEYRFGIAQSRRKTEYERWLTETLTGYTVLEVGEETSLRYADIRVELKRAGTPIPANDTWIAALCRQHALPLMSQDKHFDFVTGIHRLGW